MSISSIRIPSRWLQPDGTERTEVADFKLGKGPCGLTVTQLLFDIADGCLYVFQGHAEGMGKRFIYPLAQLTGRVEVVED